MMDCKSSKSLRLGAGFLAIAVCVIMTGAQTFGGAGAQNARTSSPFAGTWQPSTLQAQITIAVDDAVVTGAIAVGGARTPIVGGTVSGSSITFTVESPDGDRAITFRGTLSGEGIDFTRVVVVRPDGNPGGNGIYGAGGPARFTAARAPTPGSIAGRVSDGDSGRPLPKAAVQVANSLPMGTAAPAVTATVETANDGTFTIIDLPPGDYRITVTMDHYIEQEFGQRVVGGRGKPVTVHAGARHEAVNFRLTRSSVIGGTVLDPAGSPMANAEVQAFVYVYGADGSGRNLEEVGDTGRTDSLGKYRLQDLTPGEYLVTARQSVLNRAASAGMRGGGPGAGVGRGNAAAAARSSAIPTSYREIFVPVFYPGVDDPDQAAAVSVPPGADVHGIDFTLAPTTASRLIGVVLPPKNGAKQTSSPEPSGVDVFLIPLAFGGVSAPSGFGGFLDEELTRRSTATAGNGSFQFFGIVPGSYRVVAVGGEPENPATAIRDIDIRPGTTPELTLELRQGVDIAGQIYADGRTPPDFKVEQLTVMLELTPELRHNPRLRGVLTKVNADGSFVLRNAVPGARYRVRVGNAARGRASSSLVGARYGEADPLSAPIIAREGAMPLEIIVGFAFGRVEATVVNDRTPQQDITTALIPRNRARHDLYRVQQSDARGKVSFDNVPAGDYEIYAWEDVRQSHWFDPRFMKTVEDKGLAIHVDGSGTSSEIVPMITIGNGDFH